jgi:predicted nucleotidyltransferase component of viral defense system
MSVDLIQRRLDDYRCASREEEDHALREITQEVSLAGLGRTDFFKFAVFHGGTCLRILYGLNRFSEDLDFALRSPDRSFNLEKYLRSVTREVAAYGYQMEISDISKEEKTVQKAFIKDGAVARVLRLKHIKADRSMAKIRIKVEVDTNPPSGGRHEVKRLVFPLPVEVVCHDEPSLLAGKLHALLCRAYVKGRDWYDLLFYMSRKICPNYDLFSAAWCHRALVDRIRSLDWEAARKDVFSFMKTYERASLELWGADLFEEQVAQLLRPGEGGL